MDKLGMMNNLIAGLIAFAALCTLFDLLSRGHTVAQQDSKVPRDLVFAQVVLLIAVVLGICTIWRMIPYPALQTVIAACLGAYGIFLRRKLSDPSAQQSVIIPTPSGMTAVSK